MNSKCYKKDFFTLVNSAVGSISPYKLINSHLKCENNQLIISTNLKFKNDKCFNKTQNLALNNNVYILAFGKASFGMSQAVEHLIGNNLVDGICLMPFVDANKYITKSQLEIFPCPNSKIKYYYGAENNMPDKNSLYGSKKVIEFVQKLSKGDILICLISGGGSALLSMPVSINSDKSQEENLNLKIETIKAVVKAGCNINQLNTIRSCLSELKAGRLAEKASNANIISLIISDVINDELEIISSGPTCLLEYSNEKFNKSLEIIENFNLSKKIPQEAFDFLKNNSLKRTTENIKIDISVENYLIGNNKYATDAILNHSIIQDFDYKKIIMNDVDGEAKIVGSLYACLTYMLLQDKIDMEKWENSEIIKKLKLYLIENYSDNQLNKFVIQLKDLFQNKHENFKICLISGGETTVTFLDSGLDGVLGGRNQELVLSYEYTFKRLIKNNENKLRNYRFIFSSFGTDGIDGPTDSAGAYVTSDEMNDLSNLEKIYSYLLKHDSYNYYSEVDRLLKTGPTGSNVSDIQILTIEIF